MDDKPNEKTEIKVVLEPQDSNSRYILVALILVLSGLLFAILAGGVAEKLLSSDNGGKAHRDDPDCYANPTSLDGYGPNSTEANRDNDI